MKNQQDVGVARPLPGGIFSTKFNVSHRTNFHMSSLHRLVVEPFSEAEVTNVLLELSTRASMLAQYLHDFANQREVERVQEELVAERKISTNLWVEIEAFKAAQEEREKRQVDL